MPFGIGNNIAILQGLINGSFSDVIRNITSFISSSERDIKSKIESVFESGVDEFGKLVNSSIEPLNKTITNLVGNLGDFTDSVKLSIKKAFRGNFSELNGLLKDIFGSLDSKVEQNFKQTRDLYVDTSEKIEDEVAKSTEAVVNSTESITEEISKVFKSGVDKAEEFISEFGKGITETIEETTGVLGDVVFGIFQIPFKIVKTVITLFIPTDDDLKAFDEGIKSEIKEE